jgi:hypothetical protein
MADDPTKPDPEQDPAKPKPDDLGDAGKKALDAERKARRDAEAKVSELQKRIDELDEKDKSESQKLADRLAAAEKRAAEAEARVLRAEVAAEKGLTAAQAKRLVGASREELEADADEILTAFAPSGAGEKKDPPPPGSRPRPELRGGSDPTEAPPEMDPAKLAASVPRQ